MNSIEDPTLKFSGEAQNKKSNDIYDQTANE